MEKRTDFIIKLSHVQLGFIPAEEMVLCLLHNGCDTVELTTVGVGLHDLHRCPFRRTPIHCPALVYQIGHASYDFCKKKVICESTSHNSNNYHFVLCCFCSTVKSSFQLRGYNLTFYVPYRSHFWGKGGHRNVMYRKCSY